MSLKGSCPRWAAHFILIALLMGAEANALTCVHPSAGLAISATRAENILKVRVAAGRGYASVPQIEGPVGEQDLPMIKFQLESLRELGDGFEFEMPIDACDLSRSGEGVFACFRETTIQGTSLMLHSFTSYQIKQSHASGDFELRTFRMLIGTDNLFFFALPFWATYCSGTL